MYDDTTNYGIKQAHRDAEMMQKKIHDHAVMYGGGNMAANATQGQCGLGAMPFTVRAHIESEIDRLMKSINALQDLKANLPTGYLDSSAHRLAPFLDISRVG